MDSILGEVKQRFPLYSVAQRDWGKFADVIIVRWENGSKYKEEGAGNPDWFWHEWVFIIDKEEGNIDRGVFTRDLDGLEIQINQQIAYYRSPEYKKQLT